MEERKSGDTQETTVTLEDIKREIQLAIRVDIEILTKSGKIGGGILREIVGKEVYQKMLETIRNTIDASASIEIASRGSLGNYVLGGIGVLWGRQPEEERLVLHTPIKESSLSFSLPTPKSTARREFRFGIHNFSFPGSPKSSEFRVEVDAEGQISGFYYSLEEEIGKNLERGYLEERRKIEGRYKVKS